MHCCHHALPAIVRAGGGAVINMSSGAALRGASPAHVYSAAKGGILSLTRALAGTYAKDNVRVNAICAGRILTERILARYGTPDDPKPAEDQQADMRVKEYPFWVGRPEDIASIALFLASDEFAHDHRRRHPGGWRPVGVLGGVKRYHAILSTGFGVDTQKTQKIASVPCALTFVVCPAVSRAAHCSGVPRWHQTSLQKLETSKASPRLQTQGRNRGVLLLLGRHKHRAH